MDGAKRAKLQNFQGRMQHHVSKQSQTTSVNQSAYLEQSHDGVFSLTCASSAGQP